MVNAVNDAIILYWHLLHSSLFGGNSFMELYTWEKKNLCVSEMTVEVGLLPNFSWVLPVESLECTYNRHDAITSFLLSLLLAPLVVWYIAIGGM